MEIFIKIIFISIILPNIYSIEISIEVVVSEKIAMLKLTIHIPTDISIDTLC